MNFGDGVGASLVDLAVSLSVGTPCNIISSDPLMYLHTPRLLNRSAVGFTVSWTLAPVWKFGVPSWTVASTCDWKQPGLFGPEIDI